MALALSFLVVSIKPYLRVHSKPISIVVQQLASYVSDISQVFTITLSTWKLLALYRNTVYYTWIQYVVSKVWPYMYISSFRSLSLSGISSMLARKRGWGSGFLVSRVGVSRGDECNVEVKDEFPQDFVFGSGTSAYQVCTHPHTLCMDQISWKKWAGGRGSCWGCQDSKHMGYFCFCCNFTKLLTSKCSEFNLRCLILRTYARS